MVFGNNLKTYGGMSVMLGVILVICDVLFEIVDTTLVVFGVILVILDVIQVMVDAAAG